MFEIDHTYFFNVPPNILYMGPAENTLEFVYNTVCAQYFRYKHLWTHILYSKQWFPICHDHIGLLISENAQKIDIFLPLSENCQII
jgi:hypothetical protein